ncbi:ABC transporter substrate-binding protein [Abyssisolibacter fermentans]|uniref:ABC transporter substrate-binding protein n=1 Tax=Abyssisolibacter fermentans TaxID=1766203 RepID=UPI0009E9256A|nr:NrtA/SsuA/CpmA family ABC transporter substrate-binding protein [Abyssisolibacter fermentans]
MFKKYICIILAISLLFVFVGCKDNQQASLEKITLTYVKAPLNVPSIIQKNNQLFANEFKNDNIKVEFSTLTAGPKQTEALAAGEIDFLNAVGGTSVILAAANGVDLEIISTFSRCPKAFMIVTNSDNIESMADLKDKKVGGPKGTILHQLLIAALDNESLSKDDVKFMSMGIPDAMAALANGEIDAALVAGPAAYNSVKSGAKVLTTGEGLIDATIVVAASKKVIDEHPDIVKRFLKVQSDSIKWINENKDEAIKITAKETDLDEKAVKEMFDWYNFDPAFTPEDAKGLEATQKFLIDNGMLDNEININDIVANIK